MELACEPAPSVVAFVRQMEQAVKVVEAAEAAEAAVGDTSLAGHVVLVWGALLAVAEEESGSGQWPFEFVLDGSLMSEGFRAISFGDPEYANRKINEKGSGEPYEAERWFGRPVQAALQQPGAANEVAVVGDGRVVSFLLYEDKALLACRRDSEVDVHAVCEGHSDVFQTRAREYT